MSETNVVDETTQKQTLPETLALGCGNNKRDPEALGVDLRDYPDVDVRQNLEQTPWELPNGEVFPTNHFERVDVYNVLEHLPNLPAVMDEIHRVCVDGAKVRGRVTHWKDRDAYIDPTHVARCVGQRGENIVLPWPVGTVSQSMSGLIERDVPITGTMACGFDERTFDFWDSTTEYGQLEYFYSEFRVLEASRIRRVMFWKPRPIEFELEVVK